MTRLLLFRQAGNSNSWPLIQAIRHSMPEVSIDEYGIPERVFSAVHNDPDSYDLILLEHDPGPEQNGLRLLQSLKKKLPHTPPVIMLLEGTDDLNVAINAMHIGADNYIIKSEINNQDVFQKITETLRMSNSSRIQESPPGKNTSADFLDLTCDPRFAVEEPGPGPEIPGYTIIRELARGGMSSVLLAESDRHDSPIVLKMMFMSGDENRQLLKRFIQEYNLLSCLAHPNIIRIYERDFTDDFAYIAMQYLQKGDLSSRIGKGISPGYAIECLRQIASGLEAAHELNIIHRDLKPANILFGEDDTLVISDFGAAKVIDESTDITIGNALIGTPYYLSPEQGTGDSVDNRSDLYSLGVIFYEMLTGSLPYNASTVAQLIQAHLRNPIPLLEGKLSVYQPLIDGLLAKDPDDRFQNINELLAAIDYLPDMRASGNS